MTDTDRIIIDGHAWTCGGDEGYVTRFAGNWEATHADFAGEQNAPVAYSPVSPEAAVKALLEAMDERGLL